MADIDKAAAAIEQGQGCRALDNYMQGVSHANPEEFRTVLDQIMQANEAHRKNSPAVPKLELVEEKLFAGVVDLGIKRASDPEGMIQVGDRFAGPQGHSIGWLCDDQAMRLKGVE